MSLEDALQARAPYKKAGRAHGTFILHNEDDG